MFLQNSKVPDVTVSRVTDDGFENVSTRDLFAEGLYILVGVPGAFTPVCTQEHLPSLIENADQIKQAGVHDIYCISDDHRWALDIWRKEIEGSEKVIFLSDGNRDFLSAIKMESDQHDLYLSGKYGRFYFVIKNGKIKRIRSEKSVLEIKSTDGYCILSDIKDALEMT